MSFETNDRKLDHIRIVHEDAETDRRHYYFDDIGLMHRCLPELSLEQIDGSTVFLEKPLTFPLLISCMTGGDHDAVVRINRNLATAAEAAGVAMGVGSQRVMLESPAARQSFMLREVAPTIPLIANIGAVQLNYGLSLDMCNDIVGTLGADALCFHLNPLQECAQAEGDTDFRGLLDRLGELTGRLDVPVIVKEVGAGISERDATELVLRGIRYIDVAGAGGTSWSRIEEQRDGEGVTGHVGEVFQDWGIPTPEALAALWKFRDEVTLIASGGIRSGLDMLKASVLGASLSGMARPFLKPAQESTEAVGRLIDALKRQYRTGMFLLGAATVDEIRGNHDLIRPASRSGWRRYL